MKKRLLSLLLIVALLASLSVSAFAATYSDVKGHWAESYITKLSDLGYITGYTDGTVRPNKNITAVEALALLSRFYTPASDIADWIHNDYGTIVASAAEPTLSWAYDELELCLAAGILSQSELKNLHLTATIDKELLSVLLVRALQLTDQAAQKIDTKLTFVDTKELNPAYVGHVAVLVDAKIIDGDANNKFNPHGNVTRAILSKMIVCGLDYIKTQGKTLTLTNYQNCSSTTGLITAAAGSAVTVRDTAGVSRRFAVAADTTVTENGKTAVVSATQLGCRATVRVENGKVASVAVENTEGVTWVQGLVGSYSPGGSGSTIYLTNPDTGISVRYAGFDSLKAFRKGASVAVSTIAKGEFAMAKIQSGAISEIYLDSASHTVTGTIETLTLGATVTFNLTDPDGNLRLYPLDIAKLPTILRGTSPLTIERLKAGDPVTVTVKDGVVTTIATSSKVDTLDGTLTTVTTTAAGTTWVITDADGVIHALTLDSAVIAYQGTKTIDITAIQVGDTVSAECYGAVISAVTLKSSQVSSATKLTGTILAVDPKTHIITVLTEKDKLSYVSTSNVSSIISATTGRSISLSSIVAGSQLVAYGAYAGTTFQANSLVIEG